MISSSTLDDWGRKEGSIVVMPAFGTLLPNTYKICMEISIKCPVCAGTKDFFIDRCEKSFGFGSSCSDINQWKALKSEYKCGKCVTEGSGGEIAPKAGEGSSGGRPMKSGFCP